MVSTYPNKISSKKVQFNWSILSIWTQRSLPTVGFNWDSTWANHGTVSPVNQKKRSLPLPWPTKINPRKTGFHHSDWFSLCTYTIYIYSIDSLGIPFVSPCVFLHPCSFTWGEPAQNEGPLLDLGWPSVIDSVEIQTTFEELTSWPIPHQNQGFRKGHMFFLAC